MTEIMISIRPQWVQKILSGEKTIEVRKSAPEPPFKAYVYCTYGAVLYEDFRYQNDVMRREIKLGLYNVNNRSKPSNAINGKVVAEFVCERVDKILFTGSGYEVDGESMAYTNTVARDSCLGFPDLRAYLGNKTGYAWHISELKVYDKPLELSTFYSRCGESEPTHNCEPCEYYHFNYTDGYMCNSTVEFYKPIKRAPQSWQYCRRIER